MDNTQRIVPYTTKSGLKIGSAYVKPVKMEMSDDALRLQRSYLDKGWRVEDLKPTTLYYLGAIALAVATVMMGIASAVA